MSQFIYCYDIFFVLVFTVALSVCFMTYGVTGRKIYRCFGVLMFLYVLESIYMTVVVLFNFRSFGDTVQLLYFFSLAVFYSVEVCLIGEAVYDMFGRSEQRKLTAVLIASILICTCGLLIPGKLGMVLDMNMFSGAVLAFSILYTRLLRKEPEGPMRERALKYQGIMQLAGLFSVLALVENTCYIFWAQPLVDKLFPFYADHMNVSEDTFCLILSIWLVRFAQKEREHYTALRIEEALQHRMNEFQAHEQEKSKVVGREQLEEFCDYYGLTDRETEILRLILEGKSNQEVSEMLYIAVGTVKAHVHSIFGKLEVSRRSQLMTMFMNYDRKT